MKARERKAYDQYQKSNMYNLYDAYDSFSASKGHAWEYCKELLEKKNGYGLKVISANPPKGGYFFILQKKYNIWYN